MSSTTAATSRQKALRAIERSGVLLVFPIENKKEPPSLWHELYPRSQMRWEWDETGDNRVADLWRLREELARSNRVVYAKWFRGRATFFNFELFEALLRLRGLHTRSSLGHDARRMLEILEDSSPLSSKVLRKSVDLQGRFFEAAYQRALNELWSRFLIVGYGEVDDGAFPSLAIGSTQLLFEKQWRAASQLSEQEARLRLETWMPISSPFRRFYEKKTHQARALTRQSG